MKHAALALALVSASATGALARPVDGGSRIALEAGWSYVPNARFEQQAAANGHPLAHSSPGAPTVLGIFGYRPLEKLEVSIELGYSHEQFAFANGQVAQVSRMPLLLTFRYTPWVGELWPYVGAGGGYILNFVSNTPVGAVETHGAGPVVLAGLGYDVTDRLALLAEYRLSFARVGMPGIGSFNVGGNFLMIGVQYAFAPEETSQRP
ncbi:MAG: outer membrane protein [Myxococcales bacterium]